MHCYLQETSLRLFRVCDVVRLLAVATRRVHYGQKWKWSAAVLRWAD